MVKPIGSAISKRWVVGEEDPKRRRRTVVIKETTARTQSGNTSIPSHPSVFRHYNHHRFTHQHPSCTHIVNRLTLCGKMICMDWFVAHMKGGSGICPGCSSHHEHGIDNVQSPLQSDGGLYIRCESSVKTCTIQLEV